MIGRRCARKAFLAGMVCGVAHGRAQLEQALTDPVADHRRRPTAQVIKVPDPAVALRVWRMWWDSTIQERT